jgi:hypothetical protein
MFAYATRSEPRPSTPGALVAEDFTGGFRHGEWIDPLVVRSNSLPIGEISMPNVYVEARPKGRPEGSPIDDYVVEDRSDHVLATFKSQDEAIEWARLEAHNPLVARVRHLNDKKKPDYWRRV